MYAQLTGCTRDFQFFFFLNNQPVDYLVTIKASTKKILQAYKQNFVNLQKMSITF